MKKGFTLIELLVVMTIISVILGLSTIAFQASRKSARDTKRISDLQQISSGLEIYRSDNGVYPGSYNPLTETLSCSGGSTYLNTFSDPDSTRNYVYVPGSSLSSTNDCSGTAGVTTYSLCASLELPVSPLPSGSPCTTVSCGSGVTCNYEVDSP